MACVAELVTRLMSRKTPLVGTAAEETHPPRGAVSLQNKEL